MARSISTAVASSSGRNRGVLMLAALFGVLSAGLMFAFLNSRGGDGGRDTAINGGDGAQSVLVVTRNVAVGEKIVSDMVTSRTIPLGGLLEGRLTKNEEIVGKVATAPLFSGEQILAAKVTTFENQTTLAYKVPDGMRALGLQVPHEAWIDGGLVQPGDRIDVLAISITTTVDPLTGQEKVTILSGIIAQDVEVLAVKQMLVRRIPNLDERARKAAVNGTANPDGAPAAGANPPAATKEGDAGTFETAISMTLAVTPEQAAKIAIIDVLPDDHAQYRIMARQKGDATRLTGQVTWGIDDVFDTKKK